MKTAESHAAPDSLVARILAELRDNPDAKEMLLRALLSEEFLGMPVRLGRVEADIVELKKDVAVLKGDSLETKLPRRIRPLLSQRFGLRRAQVMQGALHEPPLEFSDVLESALDAGRIDDGQEVRINATDLIVRTQRKSDRARMWVAVEASDVIGQRDIERVRASSDALTAVFDEPALAVAAGYRIQAPDRRRADGANVHVVLVGDGD